MIVRITGGIGNQMFQYALKMQFDRTLKSSNEIDTHFYQQKNIHNGYELNKVFGIDAIHYGGKKRALSDKFPLLYKICFKLGIRSLKTKNTLTEIRTCFLPEVFDYTKANAYIDGYWQSEEYFLDVKEDVRATFQFPAFDEEENCRLEQMIINTQSVSIHVRRGDYVGASRFLSLGQTDYYQSAIEYIKKKVNSPLFIILSDDIKWCKKNLDLPQNSIFVTWNDRAKSYRDMQIMSICKHNIIANSSFSWWGAWLNNNPEKIVVAPSRFFNGSKEDDSHIIPLNWVKINIGET